MTSPLVIQPGESLQRLQTEYSEEFTDQFDRKFAANYDIRNMRPKEELRPVGFNPPWLPPMRYIVWERQGGFKFRWDFDTMANDLSGDATAYYSQVFEFMMEHMAGTEVPELGEPVPTKVIRSPIGKPPLSPAIPLACLAGDPWILGTPGAEVNPMLKAIIDQSATANGRQALTIIRERMQAMTEGRAIPTRPIEEDAVKRTKTIADVDASSLPALKYPEFLAACMSAGMKQGEAVIRWQQHKADLKMAQAS